MKTLLLGAWLVALLLAASLAFSAELWRDDFSGSKPYERLGPRCWTHDEGAMRFSTVEPAWLLPGMDDLEQATAKTTLTITKRLKGAYVYAGLTLYLDANNWWQLVLVSGPEGQRYFELLERLDGVHQAQLAANSPATQLLGEDTGDTFTWEKNTPYELSIELSPEAITGVITNPKTGGYWKRVYQFKEKRALKQGRPGLMVAGLEGTVDAFSIEGTLPEEASHWQAPTGRAGAVAIIDNEAGTLAAQWKPALEREGFGVMSLSWASLLEGPLPLSKIDLLVLADARRAPIQARDAVKRALRSAGKVLAIGAPAFTELVTHTSQGWVGPDKLGEAVLGDVKPELISLKQDSWHRQARFMEQQSTIKPAPAEGEDAWELSFDFTGYQGFESTWDGFLANITGAFSQDKSLLTFWAKGDATTPQMLVECKELDGSRWIATVELGADWRFYALRPQDFPYWSDSNAARGKAGDHFRPENMQDLTFGLATSHTRKVEPGQHRIWLKQVGTAVDPGGRELDFSLPEIEILCPSYKLFALKTPQNFVAATEQAILRADSSVNWQGKAYSPVWRERGRGVDRQRSWRWVPLLEARDSEGFHRGALLSLMIGDATSPNAIWANLGVADPQAAFANLALRQAVLSTVKAMVGGSFLVEGGAEFFSAKPGEELTFGATALNASKQSKQLAFVLDYTTTGAFGPEAGRETTYVTLPAGQRASASWREAAPDRPGHYEVTVTLLEGGVVADRITHDLVVERRAAPTDEDFVQVVGDNFVYKGKPWYFKGINYRPSWVGGYPNLNIYSREGYDPEIIERDLAWMESVGINAISGIFAIQPPDPENPAGYRDQTDFLDRCERHGVKVFFFMPNAWPLTNANPDWVKDYITKAGLKDHPAIMTWELAWEPISGAWGVPSGLAFFQGNWNDWVIERYGSIENAIADWGFDPKVEADGRLPVPTLEQVRNHGEWDAMVAAFRRAWNDIYSQAYGQMVNALREYDPRHLISFRFGACSIPWGQAFAHAHSVGVLKHVDFMNPEGYSLMKAWGVPTPAEQIRKGGLITLYFRHFSGEKPVVWMEFGYTVNGFQDAWKQTQVDLKPEELAYQRAEYEAFYKMFIESGARGAAPWWLPGGFRLGENSDFGVLEPDGLERPVSEILHEYLPQFDTVAHEPATATIELDLDANYPDSWDVYSEQYLALVQAGERPEVRTAGTGTDSATCPLTAVGNKPYSGHNPPIYLNGEFNSLEVRSGEGEWRPVTQGAVLEVAEGQPVYCRASLGNIGEATWLAPEGQDAGGVYLAGRADYGLEFSAPITATTPFLKDAQVEEFVLISAATGETVVSFELMAKGRAWFGERRTVVLKAAP